MWIKFPKGRFKLQPFPNVFGHSNPFFFFFFEHQSQDIPELMFQEKHFFENPGLRILNPTCTFYTYTLFLWFTETSDHGKIFFKCRLFNLLIRTISVCVLKNANFWAMPQTCWIGIPQNSNGNVLCDNLEGWDGVGVGGKFKREGTCVYLWLIHADICQRATQNCKAIILQLKINNF